MKSCYSHDALVSKHMLQYVLQRNQVHSHLRLSELLPGVKCGITIWLFDELLS